MDITKRLNSKTLSLKEKWGCTLKHIWENEFIWLKVNTTVPKFGSTRLKSFLRSIPRIRSLPGGDTFPSGLLYKPLFMVLGTATRHLDPDRKINWCSATGEWYYKPMEGREVYATIYETMVYKLLCTVKRVVQMWQCRSIGQWLVSKQQFCKALRNHLKLSFVVLPLMEDLE